MVGFGANRRGGRMPSFILVFLLAVIVLLSFNYWTLSGRNTRLLDEVLEVQAQVKRTDAARSRLEKRNSELMVQVDAHRKQLDQKDGDYSALDGKLKAREALARKCADEKIKMQSAASDQMTEIQRLEEHLKDLKIEFMKQEEQLKEVKRNSSTLERKLEYESLQCGRQIAQLKMEYEESKKSLENEASKMKKKDSFLGKGLEGEKGLVGEHQPLTTKKHNSLDLKDEMVKPGSDAGMPGIEDGEVGKLDIQDVQFGLKSTVSPTVFVTSLFSTGTRQLPPLDLTSIKDSPLLSNETSFAIKKHDDSPDVVVGAGEGPAVGAADGLAGQGLSLDRPRLQEGAEPQDTVIDPPGTIKKADRPVVFEEDNKVAIKADEFGEQQRQLQAPDNVKEEGERLKGVPLPPNPAQLPNPIQPKQAKDKVAAEAVHHRQNDDERELQGERAVDYGKRHQPIDIL